MPRFKEAYKRLRSLSFKESTIDAILRDEQRAYLLPTDEKDFRKLGREYFVRHNVGILREMAKRMGVESPSVAPKEVLLDKMMDTLWGLQYFENPAKALAPVSLERLTPDDELTLIEERGRGEFVLGNVAQGVFEGDETGGIIRVGQIFRSNDYGDVGVTRRLVNEFGIKSGDVVQVRSRYVDGAKCQFAFYVDMVNGIKTTDTRPVPDPAAKSERIKLSTLHDSAITRLTDALAPISTGQFLMVSCSGRIDYGKWIKDYASAFARAPRTDEVIMLCLGETGDLAARFSEFPGGVYSSAGDMAEDARIAVRARDYALSRARVGKNAVILINNFDHITGGDIEKGFQMAQAACRPEGGGSVTIVAFIDRDDPNGMYHKIKYLATAELSLIARPFLEDFTVDIAKCFTSPFCPLSDDELTARSILKKIALKDESEIISRIKKGGNTNEFTKKLVREKK